MSDAALPEIPSQQAAAPVAVLNEDWLAVILDLLIFVLALASFANVDLIGWAVTTSGWSFAHFAAVTPAEPQKFGINWSLKLADEGGYIFALTAGLILPIFFRVSLRRSRRPCGGSSTSKLLSLFSAAFSR